MTVSGRPAHWRAATVADVVDPRRPVTYGIVQPGPFYPEGVAMIRGQDYSSGEVATDGLFRVHPAIASAYRRAEVKGGDLLLSIVGYVGQVAQVPHELAGANLTQTTARIAIRDEFASRFFLHYFRTTAFAEAVRRITKGSAQPGLNLADVERLPVLVPPPTEQGRIADTLDLLDELIATSDQLVTKLRRLTIGLARDLLSRGVDEDGHARADASDSATFIDSPLGRVPGNWEVATLSAYGSRQRPYLKTGPFGSSLNQDHWTETGTPVITIGALGEGELSPSALLYVSEQTAAALAAYAVEPGDVVFSRVADVGRSVVITQDQRGWIMSSNLMWLSVDQRRALPEWLQANLALNPAVRTQIRSLVNAAGRDVANGAVMNALQFPWPPRDEQERIVGILENATRRIRAEELASHKLRLLRAGLTDDLLTGRVAVTTGVQGGAS